MNKVGPKSFIQQIKQERASASAPPDPKDPKAADKQAGLAPKAKIDARVADAPGVPEKIAAQHGGAFKGAVPDLEKIAELKSALVEFREKQLGRVLEQFYKVLGKQLEILPDKDRAKVAEKNVASMRGLIEAMGQGELLVPVIAAAVGLFDSGVRLQARGKSPKDAKDAVHATEDAARAVQAFAQGIEGRTGQSSAINVFGPIVEQLELGYAQLARADRVAIFDRVRGFLEETAPRHGFDMAMTAAIAEHVTRAAGAHPGDAAKALEKARKEFLEPQRGAYEQAIAGLDGPLKKILEASPAGPEELFTAVDQIRAALPQVPKEFEALVKSPAAPEALAFLARHAGALTPELLAQPLPSLVLALSGVAGDLGVLPAATGIQVALAIPPGAGADTVRATADFARSTTPDHPAEAFRDFAARHVATAARMPQYPGLDAVKDAVTTALARAKLEPAQTQELLLALQTTAQYLLKANIASLVESALPLVDPRARFANPPVPYLAELLAAAAPHVAGDKDRETAIARVAIELAVNVGQIHGGQALHSRRILADFGAAAADPKTLHFAARAQGGVAVRGQPTIPKFLEAHPELPVDFAFTAGKHLTADQMTWAIDRVAKTRGRSTVRLLRDFVFGCIEANRLDLVEAARVSQSPAKALSAVMTEVAQSYRNNQAAQVPFDALIAGLAANGDPIAELSSQKAAHALAALKLEELAGGKVDPRGVEEIMKIQANVADLLMQYSPNFKSELDGEVDMGALRPVFLESLKSVVQGTWPKPKYENEVGKRIMAILTPEQQRVWRETMITPEAAVAAGGDPAANAAAMQLLRGLVQAIPKEAKLGGAGLPANLDFSPRTAGELAKMRGELLEQLHAAQKGSAEHKAASAKLGPVAANLAVIELQLEIARLAINGADAVAVMRELAPRLAASTAALRKTGARGCAEAVGRVLDVASTLEASPRKGRYAADEDGLTHMIDSHKSGCLSFGDRRRRWGMAGALADPNIRMLRGYVDDKQVYRAFLKFFMVEAHGYKGPALWMDGPVADGGGSHADQTLLYKHIFAKARAMGVPVYGYLQNPPADFVQRNGAMKIIVDDGNTGIMHSDSMFPAGKGSIRQMRGANPTWNMDAQWPIYFPPNIKLA